MQTFLPFADFQASAKALDSKRLGKQRVETWQLIQSLTIEGHGWRHHPASKMWQGCTILLADYGIRVCEEWIRRGFRDTLYERFDAFINENFNGILRKPLWLGSERFHRSHRSNLIRKLPRYYRDVLGWTEPDNLPYVWPNP